MFNLSVGWFIVIVDKAHYNHVIRELDDDTGLIGGAVVGEQREQREQQWCQHSTLGVPVLSLTGLMLCCQIALTVASQKVQNPVTKGSVKMRQFSHQLPGDDHVEH